MMSAKSFGTICDDWVRNNPDYAYVWNYRLDDSSFDLTVTPAKETSEEFGGRFISAKANIPNTPEITVPVVGYVLELLRTQVDLYERYGIKA